MALFVVNFSTCRAESTWIEHCLSGVVGAELWKGCWLIDDANLPGLHEERFRFLGASGGYVVQPIDPASTEALVAAGASVPGRDFFHRNVAPLLAAAQPHRIRPFQVSWLGDGETHFTDVIERIRADYALAQPTPLCRLMAEHGSDKGLGWHNYTPLYSELLASCAAPPRDLLEIGLGTNNPLLASNMGVDGVPGASLRGWREFLPQARIVGADIDTNILFAERNIETFFVDQLRPATFDALWTTLERRQFDFIIDDGLHTLDAAINTLDRTFPWLRSGGIYVIEDVVIDQLDAYEEMARRKGLSGFLLVIPNYGNVIDNAVLVARA